MRLPNGYIEFAELLMEADMLAAFKLSPEKAVGFLTKKAGKLVETWNWDEMKADSHHKAFTVAKTTGTNILQTLYDSVLDYQKGGQTLAQWKKELIPILQKKGWWGKSEMVNPKTGKLEMVQLGSEHRLKIIAETNARVNYARGEYKQMTRIAARFPNWKYSQIQRPHKNPKHAKFHNKVFRWDDPIWKSIYPPSQFGCKCEVFAVSDAELKTDGLKLSSGSKYDKYLKENKAEFGVKPLENYEPDLSSLHKKLQVAVKKDLKPAKKKKALPITIKSINDIKNEFNAKINYEDLTIKKRSDKVAILLFNNLINFYKKYPKLKEINLELEFSNIYLRQEGCVGLYDIDNKKIYLQYKMGELTQKQLEKYQNDMIKLKERGSTCKTIVDIYRHELGHKLFHEKLTYEEQFAIRNELGFEVKENLISKNISKYALTDSEECFAEMFNLYIGYGKDYKFAPETIKIIKNTLTNLQ